MDKLRQNVRVGILLVALTATGSCTPRMFNTLATAAIFTAVIVGTAHVMAHHDAHYHHHHCGHERRWHDERWVYHYNEHWEYYDPHTRRWYAYE